MKKKRVFSQEQDDAANPSKNVWVQANAGTGKTSVLIQRLLRILFRAPDPSKTGILCLTYTNAAAGEMRNRILNELRTWVSASDDDIADMLDGVCENKNVTNKDVARARKIFFIYIDNPDMLKIKTIHGFCEEILRRFPIEAGISPAWSLVSDESQIILLQNAFARLLNTKDVRTGAAFEHVVNRISEYSLPKILDVLSKQYKGFFDIDDFDKHREYFIDKTKEFLNINMCNCDAFNPEKLEIIITQCNEVQKTLKKPAKYLSDIVSVTRQYIDKTIDFQKYKSAYLKQNGEPLQKLEKYDFLLPEQDRVYSQNQFNINKKIFDDTVALFDLSAEFAKNYIQIKREHNVLDFEDLILYTRKLFSDPKNMGYVLSQLDVSLSHILVDEAQDTSPLQWDILRLLSGDFFTDGDTENSRSLFVVGDTKQSIYGFMGADPDAFATSRKSISNQIQNNLRTISDIPLSQSFRSLSSILYAVDAFFDAPNVRTVSGFINNKHMVSRRESAGLVEINKLVSKQETNETAREYISSIANRIKQMIDSGGYTANEIMVLVQKRAPFASMLVNDLKRLGVPVAGSDRIVLPNFPAITDLLNLVRFCIDNSDDYRLCCVLKSPLYRFSESDLYKLCAIKNTKSTTVFDALVEYNQPIHDDLMDIIQWSQQLSPYSFFTKILNHNDNRKKMIAALGDQIIDPLEEFITICLAYERTQPGTLRHFLKWFITGGAEIKRDMDSSAGVRVMTVHGSKGLQSRVVFLIDTVRTPDTESILPVPNTNTWLWIASSDCASNAQSVAADKLMTKRIAEYYRLLYVAMTRACDELYIYGFTPYKNAPDISWHNQLWNVLSNVDGATKDDNTIRIIHE